eukprot:1711856-Amphidinium_carterae.1
MKASNARGNHQHSMISEAKKLSKSSAYWWLSTTGPARLQRRDPSQELPKRRKDSSVCQHVASPSACSCEEKLSRIHPDQSTPDRLQAQKGLARFCVHELTCQGCACGLMLVRRVVEIGENRWASIGLE